MRGVEGVYLWLSTFLPFFVLNILTFATRDKCFQSCCCWWCRCSPDYEEYVLDPERPFDLIPWEPEGSVEEAQEDHEMIVVQTHDGTPLQTGTGELNNQDTGRMIQDFMVL